MTEALAKWEGDIDILLSHSNICAKTTSLFGLLYSKSVCKIKVVRVFFYSRDRGHARWQHLSP